MSSIGVVRGAEWWRPVRPEPAAAAPAALPEEGSAFSTAAFWCLLAFTFILLIAPQTIIPGLAFFRIALLTAVLALLFHLADCMVRSVPVTSFSRELCITASLAAWAALTVPFSIWPGGSISFLLEVYAKTLVLFWLLSQIVSTPRRLSQVAWTLTLLSLPLAGAALEHFLSGSFLGGGEIPEAERIMGYGGPLTENPNDLALMLNLILPLSVALMLMQRRGLSRLLLAGIVAVQVGAIVATYSRAGFLTLAVTGLTYIYVFLRGGRMAWIALVLAAVLAALPLVPDTYVERLGTITDIEADPTGSAQTRWQDTGVAMDYVARNPLLGAGVGMNILAMNEARGSTWLEVHNAYLEYAVELGLPGLLLFVALLLACLGSARRARRLAAGDPARATIEFLAQGIGISLMAFAVAALFHPVAYDFYFYYIAGLAVAVRAMAEAAPAGGDPRRKA